MVAAAPVAIAVAGALLGLAIPVGILYFIIRLLQDDGDKPQGTDPPEGD